MVTGFLRRSNLAGLRMLMNFGVYGEGKCGLRLHLGAESYGIFT
jgi:hypothetical protein